MQDRKIFIDTHIHTNHSELDGMCKLEDYIEYGKRNKFPALFCSDHGNISCWIPFYLQCKEANIKPILGSEFYLSEGLIKSIDDINLTKENKNEKENKLNFHLNLYAKNIIGYKNIIKLTTWANVENFYKKPRITFDILKQFSEGIICTTSCVGSIFAYYILKNQEEKAIDYICKFKELFKDDFYIEYGYHYFESEKKYIEKLRRLAKNYNIKTIIANDTHYMYKEDEVAHKILMCKGEQTLLDKSDFNYTHNYYKSYCEICETFSEFSGIDVDKCMENTFEIINKVEDYNIKLNDYIYPVLPNTCGLSQDLYLEKIIKEGLKNRFGDNVSDEIKNRIKYELSVIKKMNFSGYFNVVSDYTSWAKKSGIPVGAGRGSGAGSLINYVIGITEVNPLEYDLLFERFLNPDRKGFPDIDIDYETSSRPLIIKYLTEKYGQKGCVPISTRGFLKGKSSIKVVASKLGLNFNKYNKLLSLIKDPSIDTVQKVIDSSEELTSLYNTDEEFKKVVNIAKNIEGSIQSISVHASAVCLDVNDISDHIPIIRTKDGYATGWTDKIVEKCGLIKYDILGLSNLSVIDNCCKLIGGNFDIKNIPLDDKKTYKNLQNGDNLGCFQIESQGMKSLLKRLKPENIEHISAILALYRPGSMQFIDDYIKYKNKPDSIVYFDERVRDVLSKTYGQIIYQEQVMQIARTLAGYSMSEADDLRKAIGKKIMSEMLKHEEKFINGCVQNGMNLDKAEILYHQIVEFAKYSFNASHSASYSFITYQTAYLKTNYPVEFMTALLNCNSDNLDKLNLYLSECYRLGISVLPPDINKSNTTFTISDDNKILFGLSAIKGLGKSAITDIINARKNGKFNSIVDFIERTNKVDKGCIQALLKVGAFNNIESNPKFWDVLCDYINDAKNSSYYKENLDIKKAVYHVVGSKNAKKSEKYLELAELKRNLGSSSKDKILREEYTLQQGQIIDIFIENTEKYFLGFSKYEVQEKIQNEQNLLGFNISTNPYKRWNDLEKFFTKNTSIPYITLNALSENGIEYANLPKFYTVGVLSDIKELVTKKGDKMAKLTFEYYGAKTTVTVFSKQWENELELKVKKGNMCCITGKLVETNKQYTDEDYEIRMYSIQQLNAIINEDNKCIIDISHKDKDYVDHAVKTMASQDRQSNLPIEKIVLYKKDDKYLVLNGLCWINNADKLAQKLT